MIGVLRIRDLKIILSNLGLILTITSPTLLIPITVAILYSERAYIFGFAFAFVLMLATGMGLWKVFESEREMKLRHAIAVTALSYLVISLFSAIPIGAVAPTFLDAYFEAMSGWTTTGLSTIAAGADTFPHSINLWRHLMQYVGGMGIVVMSLVVLSKAGTGIESTAFYSAEGRIDKIGASMVSTVRTMWIIYLGFFLVGAIVLHMAGMTWFDAVSHSMSGFGTGGFSTHAESIGYFDSVLIESVLIVIMILGSMNFVLLSAVLSGNLKEFVKNIENKVFVVTFLIFLFPIIWALTGTYSSTSSSIRMGVYHLISALTGTGWMLESPSNVSIVWSPFVQVLLALAMTLGASAGSTGGGIKRIRVGLIATAIWLDIQRTLFPDGAVIVNRFHHIKERVADDKTLREVFVMVFAYVTILMVSTLATMTYGYSFSDSFFEASSALGTVGQTTGITDAAMPTLLKIVYILDMWAGRLEVLPVLIFIVSVIGRGVELLKRTH